MEPSFAFTPSLEQKETLQTEDVTQVLPTPDLRPSLGHETSAQSVQSDSTLEFHDAPSPADVMRPEWHLRNRLDEDSEVIVRRPESDPATKTLSAEEPPVGQEKKNDEDVSGFEMQLNVPEGHAKEDAEEPTSEREAQNFLVPVTSLEESNQDDSVNPEVVLAPREPIRTFGMSEKTIREEEIRDSEPASLPITDDDITTEEPIRESSKESCESAEHLVVNDTPVGELPASNSDAVSEELKDKHEAMETSGESSYQWAESG